MAKRILIVEDDETNATIINDYLAAHGYDTRIARDGVEGIQLFREHRPDLVLVDVLLPRKNGFDLCFDLRAEADTPILLMSAVGREVYAEAAARADRLAEGYLRKPFALATVLERVTELVGPA